MKKLSTELLEEIEMHIGCVRDKIESELPVNKEQARDLAESVLVDILYRYYNGGYINWRRLEQARDELFG